MRGVDDPSPREYAPGALWIVHRFQHGVGRVTGGGAVVADRDQAAAVRVDLLHDGLEQGRPWRGQSGVPCFWHLAQLNGPHTLASAIQPRDGRGRPRLPCPVAQWHIDPSTPYRKRRLKPACGRPGLGQPANDVIHLRLLAMGPHPCPQTVQEFAQRGT